MSELWRPHVAPLKRKEKSKKEKMAQQTTCVRPTKKPPDFSSGSDIYP
jgi:hypothetical protein